MVEPPDGKVPSSYSALQAHARLTMVREHLEPRGINDPRVLEAFRQVPRHLFVPLELQPWAHADRPLAIGYGQTLSQPYVAAFMAQSLALGPQERVLEVGSGSGYLAAVLSRLALEVYGVEREPALCERSRAILDQVGCSQVQIRRGDGAQGWPAAAPFDAIVFSCACTGVPAEPWRQLAQGGRLLLPLGPVQGPQELVLIRKQPLGSQIQRLMAVAFVPLRPG